MEKVFRIVRREKVVEILGEMSSRLRFPLAITDDHGVALVSAAEGGGWQWTSAPVTIDHPLHFNGDPVGRLSAPVSAGDLGAAVFFLENTLRLEAENIDRTAEVVRVYEELALI